MAFAIYESHFNCCLKTRLENKVIPEANSRAVVLVAKRICLTNLDNNTSTTPRSLGCAPDALTKQKKGNYLSF